MEKAKADRIFEEICQNIGGDWLLIGGTLVQFAYDGERATEDIDLVQIRHAEKSKEAAQNELFKFTLAQWGFGPEFVNTAAEFFVNQFDGWQSEIKVMKEGPKGRIFRPSITLFCATKLRRGSDLDLDDIRTALRKKDSPKLDFQLLARWLPTNKLETLRKMITENQGHA